jgi:hypothetical protein
MTDCSLVSPFDWRVAILLEVSIIMAMRSPVCRARIPLAASARRIKARSSSQN